MQPYVLYHQTRYGAVPANHIYYTLNIECTLNSGLLYSVYPQNMCTVSLKPCVLYPQAICMYVVHIVYCSLMCDVSLAGGGYM